MVIFVLDLHCCPGHFFLRQRFLPVLWRFPGHFLLPHHFLLVLPSEQGCFPAATPFSPGKVVFFRTFLSHGGFFSRKCGVFRDISSPRGDFLLEKWRFSGHILPSKELSPGNEASFRTFPFCALWNFLFLKIAVFKKSATLKVFLFPKKDFTHLL